ncbi:MAG: zinc metallopeptidase [Bacteroidales bacterium]|nr:zinc metallopeptidase [Bacteroidales bacterium]
MNAGWLLIIIVFVLGLLVQARMNSVFNKYSQVYSPGRMSGKEIAEKMLHDNGIYDVKVVSVQGRLTDHFNPADKTINLSESVYNQRSVAAAAVAAHETGHALQHATNYAPLRLRSSLVPLVQFSSTFSQIVIILGIMLIEIFPFLFWIGIMMFAMVLIFSLVTLPVEYNASSRALAWLSTSGGLSSMEVDQAKEALMWAARTYVVSALSALATLLYYLGFARNR